MSKVGRVAFEERLRDKITPQNSKLIMLAYRLAKYAHRGQRRDGGKRYFDHPKRVALILIDELQIYDHEMIIAALLHDLKEDTFMLEWDDIELIWGMRVKEMVDALTKEVHLTDREERDRRYKTKIRAADRQTKLVKLADRLDNLRDFDACTPEKQRRYIQETRRDYLPLAWKTNRYLYRKMREICDVFILT